MSVAPTTRATIQPMPTFLIEIHMADAGDRELERAVRMLNAAQTRMRGSGIVTRATIAGLSREDGRLVCLIEAPSLERRDACWAWRSCPVGGSGRSPDSRARRYSAVTQAAMVTLELKPSLLRML